MKSDSDGLKFEASSRRLGPVSLTIVPRKMEISFDLEEACKLLDSFKLKKNYVKVPRISSTYSPEISKISILQN